MKLPKNQEVLIVGGGIIGLSLARELDRRGVEKITIIEKNSAFGTEASSAAAGMLAPQAEADRADLFFEFCRESRDSYPKFAAELLSETGVDVELDRTGTLYLAFSEKDSEELDARYNWQKSADLQVEKLSAKEVLELEPNASPEVLSGLRFPLDWQVENRKIIEALDSRLKRISVNESARRRAAGGTSTNNRLEFVCAAVESLIFENNRAVGVRTNRGDVVAENVVIASGAWTSLIKDKFGLLSGMKVAPVRGQMISFKSPEKMFRHVIYTPRGYVVPRKDWRILVGATVEEAGFENCTTAAGMASLKKLASEVSPVFENLKLHDSWSGLRPTVADGLPVLGEFPGIENLSVATAHYRNGILLAPKTSEILADKITGVSGDSKYLEGFSPRRFAGAEKF